MASTSRVHQCSTALVCIVLSALTYSTSAIPIPWEIPDADQTQAPPEPAGGFHLRLSEDISVTATDDVAVLKRFTIDINNGLGNNRELFSKTRSGFDNINGIFRPSNGYYFLSTVVHVSLVEEASSSPSENSTDGGGEKDDEKPSVTVSICINENCGDSA